MMMNKIESYLGIKDPKIPSETNYKIIVDYLIESHRASIKYYWIVLRLGLLGLVFSVLLLLILIYQHNCNWGILFQVKEYPGIICSFITASFGHIEMEEGKKELYRQLKEVSSNNINPEDTTTIVGDYKKWAWSEFQEKFKP